MPTPCYDVLVLGGGTAGCVLASRLSENPDRTVCLVEAGPDYGPYAGGMWPPDLLDARWLPNTHAWPTDREDRWQRRARILGGCSAHNGCFIFEGSPEDYGEWGKGWTYPEFAPYLRRAREMLRTRVHEQDALSPWHRAVAAAAGRNAIVHPVNAVGIVRWNAAFAYIDPARRRPNLTIRAEATVDQVLLSGSRAYGALTSVGELHADTVIVASGTYGSPGILLRSGIGPATGLPVGEGLRDHVGVGLAFEGSELLSRDIAQFAVRHPLFMGQVTVSARSRSCPDGPCDLFLFPALDPERSISVAAVAMKPSSRGTVRLNALDSATPLAVDHGFLSEPEDIQTLADGIDLVHDLVASTPICRYIAREIWPGRHVRPRLAAIIGARGFFHPVGTCSMGTVVDSGGAVLGYDGLRVADASVIPTIPRANTNLTVAALAERIAELVQMP